MPVSKTVLDLDLGEDLAKFRAANDNRLLKNAAQCVTYIWAIDAAGTIHISVEELAMTPEGTHVTGYPRRRNFPNHPAEEKKLGHPCLVDGNNARIGGELFLDESDAKLCWYVNVNSGRYCRISPPGKTQVDNVVNLFRELVEDSVQLDDLEDQ